MASFSLSIVAPDRTVFEGNIQSVLVPGTEGYFGVMSAHVPMIGAMKPGILEFTGDDNNRYNVYVGGGFFETNGSRATVLADEAQLATEIDLTKAEHSLEEARKALRGEDSELSPEEATLELDRAMQKIRAARAAR